MQSPAHPDRHQRKPMPVPLSAGSILARLDALKPTGAVLSAIHNDHHANTGGVQLCVQREEQAAIQRGLAYLSFHPWQHWPGMAPEGVHNNLPVDLMLNGTPIGTTAMGTLALAMADFAGSGRPVRLAIHHLTGHSPEAIVSLARAAQARAVAFWLHDLFTLCQSYTLQPDQLTSCGAPDIGMRDCGHCPYGTRRASHLARIAALFSSGPVTAIAPSRAMAELWSAKSNYQAHRLATIPHVTLHEQARADGRNVDPDLPITVGYLGGANPRKGWHVFADIAERHAGPGMRFIAFSKNRPKQTAADWRQVAVTAEQPDAMTRSIESADVDVVINWPSVPETFSLTTYEALEAGAWVLTHPLSGNVQAAVTEMGRGFVLKDPEALHRMFLDGSLAHLVSARRARTARSSLIARYSSLSFDLPEWQGH